MLSIGSSLVDSPSARYLQKLPSILLGVGVSRNIRQVGCVPALGVDDLKYQGKIGEYRISWRYSRYIG